MEVRRGWVRREDGRDPEGGRKDSEGREIVRDDHEKRFVFRLPVLLKKRLIFTQLLYTWPFVSLEIATLPQSLREHIEDTLGKFFELFALVIGSCPPVYSIRVGC